LYKSVGAVRIDEGVSHFPGAMQTFTELVPHNVIVFDYQNWLLLFLA